MQKFFESAGFQFSAEQYGTFIANGGTALYDDLVELVHYHVSGGQSVVQSVAKMLLKENFSGEIITFLKSQTAEMLSDKDFFALIVSANTGEKIPMEALPSAAPEEEYVWREFNLSSVEEYEQAFKAVKLEHKWSFFKEQLKPEIRLELTKTDEIDIPVASSKIGGKPDLPDDISWPIENNEAPLSFLAQINLAEIAPTGFNTELPTSGMLYFFYSSTQESWGGEIEGADKFKSFYLKDTHGLKRRDFPEFLVEGIFPACAVRFRYGYGLPNWEYDFVAKNLEKSEQYPYIDVSSVHNRTRTKLLGHANSVQGPMEFECEQVTKGYTWKDTKNEKLKQEIKEHQYDWTLLFQLDSEREAEMCWGDVGRLFFWIRKSDLKKHHFEKTWMILQCG